MPAKRTPLKLLPAIAEAAEARADQLNLSKAGYVSALIWNYAQAPFAVTAECDTVQRVRVPFTMYWRAAIDQIATDAARQAGLSINALVESLIATELRSPEPTLTLLPMAGSKKPSARKH